MTPRDWRLTSLGELCRFKAGSAFPRDEQGARLGEVPFIKVSDMNLPENTQRIRVANNWVSDDTVRRMKLKPAPTGAVVFAKIGEALKAERLRELVRPTVVDNNMMAAVPNDEAIYPAFLRFLLEDVHLATWAEGSALPYLRQRDLENIPVAVPARAEQSGIAATLGSLDDKIESSRRAIALANDLLDVLSESALGDLPTEPLRALVEVSRSTLNPGDLGDAMIDHFSIPAFDDRVWPQRVPAASVMSNKLVLNKPSILLSRLNPRFNRTWWAIPESGVAALASTEFTQLSASSAEDLAGIWLAVRSQFFRDELPRRVTGTSGSHQRIRPDDLLNIDVPDTRLVSRTVKQRALALLELMHTRRREVVDLSALRDVLLPELLSGRLRVREALGVEARI